MIQGNEDDLSSYRTKSCIQKVIKFHVARIERFGLFSGILYLLSLAILGEILFPSLDEWGTYKALESVVFTEG